jgi:O-acetylhomoserine/O-acetylserine sulfhydrylase-like pyridoxal-dependent enzyme
MTGSWDDPRMSFAREGEMQAQGVPDRLTSVREAGAVEAARLVARRARMRKMRFDTIAVHGVYDMEEALRNQGAIIEPVYAGPAQHFASSDAMEAALGYLVPAWGYSRITNPTVAYAEETLALLESYGSGLEASAYLTSSGMSAVHMTTAPFLDVRYGATMNIVAGARCYGGTYMLFSERYGAERGVEIRWVPDVGDITAWEAAIDARTRFVYVETPSNPSLAVADVEALASVAHRNGVPLIVDATVATPALLRPLALGADVVVHSVSKCLAASGAVIAGALISRRDIVSRTGPEALRQDFATYVKLLPGRDHGPALAPASAASVLHDLRTLRGRVDQMSRGAIRVAEFLAAHPGVDRVWYPGLPSHPGHDVATRQMRLVDAEPRDGAPERFGYLLGFEVRGGPERARDVFDGLRLVFRATDLGRVKSVATIPAISTHQQQGDAGRALGGVPDNLVRLSIGCEHPDDLIADLDWALAGAARRTRARAAIRTSY